VDDDDGARRAHDNQRDGGGDMWTLSLSLSLLYSVIYREEGGLLGASITHTQGRYLAIERSLAERPIRRPDDESCGHYLTTGKEEGKNSGQFRPATALTR